ncbi:hypothetical protein [Pseudonocardia sp. KRD291]|uniref:hypothetical protein n=1 Tax=Pseudonocardia sp. KRD291 TaxID=2792007 RepID=UPI0027E25A63|nr:hypothetical protein [Pseudonocardia sp. KRD291]
MSVLALAAPALAGPAPGGPVPAQAPGPGCTVDDDRLGELSGLVADGDQRWGIVDSGSRAVAYRIDARTCAVTGTRAAPIDPADVEDLATGPDGALWLADIGDNAGRRDSVALVVLPRSGPPRLHRLVYPDGPRDAEALVVGDDGVPVIVTKASGAAGVYRPSGPLAEPGPTPLVRAGQVVLPVSSTAGGPLGGIGTRTITGAGLSPAPSGASAGDRRVLALRTYTDAWLFPLPADGVPPDADRLVAALAGAPVAIPLPDEPQGEAVALTADGTLLSGSEARGGRPAAIRTVPGAAAAALAPGAAAQVQPATPPPTRTFPPWLPAVLGGAAVVVLLLGAGVAMTLHGRRRARR